MNDSVSLVRYRASYHTLGCKLNFAETSAIGRALAEHGILRAVPGEIPDICVVNTCSVTETADRKCRHLIRSLHRKYPAASIVVTGCYAQLNPGEISGLEGVEIVLGTGEKARAAEYIGSWLFDRRKTVDVTPAKEIREFSPSCERGDRTRFFLKIQDGCDYFCSYCTIPFARGRSRSGTVEEICGLARRAASEGGKEIIITGVNIGDFGRGKDRGFFDLIRSLDAVEGIERFRISSIEPNLLTPDMIRWIASESRAFMPHFHIPLQSGSDTVLKMMGRRYDTDLFRSRVELIRELIPDAHIGVDVIAGARGESGAEWRKSLAFIESLPVTRLHVFPYSERPGTRALSLPGAVPVEERHRRVAELMAVSDGKLQAFSLSQVGKTRSVLWERPHETGRLQGLTDNYLRVVAACDPSMVNTISNVILTDADGDVCEGTVI